MLGHYFFLTTLVHDDVILWMGAIIAKLNKIGVIANPIFPFYGLFYFIVSENYRDHSEYFKWVDDMKIRIWNIPAVLLTWLSIKYNYYLPFDVLIFTSVKLLRSMAFFYSLLFAGDTLDSYPIKLYNLQCCAYLFRNHKMACN